MTRKPLTVSLADFAYADEKQKEPNDLLYFCNEHRLGEKFKPVLDLYLSAHLCHLLGMTEEAATDLAAAAELADRFPPAPFFIWHSPLYLATVVDLARAIAPKYDASWHELYAVACWATKAIAAAQDRARKARRTPAPEQHLMPGL